KTIGKIGQALNFDGTNKYVSIGNSASLNDLGSTTISIWIYPRRISGDSSLEGALLERQQGQSTGWFLEICTDGDVHGLCTGKTNTLSWVHQGALVPPSNTISLNTWQHIAITHASGTPPTIYVNGQQKTYTGGVDGIDDNNGATLTIGDRL